MTGRGTVTLANVETRPNGRQNESKHIKGACLSTISRILFNS